jgi:hypothetical protein
MAFDIPKLFQDAAAGAFAFADSTMTDAILNIIPAGLTVQEIDMATDTPIVNMTAYNVRGLMYQSREQKLALDAAVLATFMVQAQKVIAAGLTTQPTQDNAYLTIGGIFWNISAVDFDPATALYIFQIRRT